MTQDELGERAFVSRSYIAHFEAAGRKPSLEMAVQIDEVLDTGGFFERLCRKLLEASPFAAYFAKVAELEKLATKICEFAPTVIPGLLHTHEPSPSLPTRSLPMRT